MLADDQYCNLDNDYEVFSHLSFSGDGKECSIVSVLTIQMSIVPNHSQITMKMCACICTECVWVVDIELMKFNEANIPDLISMLLTTY